MQLGFFFLFKRTKLAAIVDQILPLMVILCRLETFHYLPPSGKAQEF